MNMEEAFKIVSTLPTPPSAIVSSGNGIHACFKFWKPAGVTNEILYEKIKNLSLRLRKYISLDNMIDLIRVLRLPRNINLKEKSRPKQCGITNLFVRKL